MFATWFTIDKLATELHNSACCVTRASCRINNTDTQLDILAKLSREKSSLSKCTYSFFTLSRYEILVSRDENLVSRDENLVSRDENRVLREGGNLLLSGTVALVWYKDLLLCKNKVLHFILRITPRSSPPPPPPQKISETKGIR